MTALGKGICHQKPSKMQYPLAPSRQLSPKDVNVGWCPRYDVSNGCFPSDVRFRKKLLAKEFNPLAHRLVDIILELCVMN
jgi:hypothetical protein